MILSQKNIEEIAVAVISSGALIILQFLGGYNVGYESMLLLIVSTCLFYILLKSEWRLRIWEEWICKMSLGFYFLQGPVLSLIVVDNFGKVETILGKVSYTIALLVITFLLCGIISQIISKNSFLRRYLLRA